jgi:carbamoyltransferase
MITWGISALTHDAAISVIDNNQIVFAAHAERYSKIKNDPNLNDQIIRAASEYGKPDSIVWFENRWLKKWRQFKNLQWQYLFNLDRWPNRYMRKFGIKQEIVSVKHHLSHAAAGFLTSEFDEACIICIDSLGEDNTITVWKGNGTDIQLIKEINYPHSIGMLYTAFTQRCSLIPNEEEYILMGMAPYGRAEYSVKIVRDFIKHPSFALQKNIHKGIGNWMPHARYEDLAASIQCVLGWCLEELLREHNGISKNLVFMGGVALNCVANRKLHKYFDNVWIMPNPGDSGSSLGCAAYHAQTRLKWNGPYLGTNIDRSYPIEEVHSELMKGNIVGVANGRAEFGPRAFGNRSLLADPRSVEMKDRVNEIKHRQKFRPFAPVVLEEYAHEYFNLKELNLPNSPYMQYTVKCKYPKDFPAIVHVDGTSRIQTINRKQNPGYYDLLHRFYESTGCPMLLNTSLNIRGMPMVDDKKDAKLFAKTYNVKVF